MAESAHCPGYHKLVVLEVLCRTRTYAKSGVTASPDGSESGRRSQTSFDVHRDDRLAELVAAWPRLSDAAQAALVGVVRSMYEEGVQ